MQHRSFLLECTPATFRPGRADPDALDTVLAPEGDEARCRRLWLGVGEGFWTERSRWGLPRWRRHLGRAEVTFWIATVVGEDVGCFELTRMARGVRIDGFGLLPGYRGRGLGRTLLDAAMECALATGAPKVWLHTATDDHPAALPNYLGGGYRIVRERPLRNPMPGPRSRGAETGT